MIKSNIFRVGLKNTSYLTLGNIISQIFGFFFIVFVARKFSQEDYGIYITAQTFVGLFGFLTLDGYYKVILREISGETDKAKFIIEKTIAIKTAFTIFTILLTIIANLFVNDLQKIQIAVSIYSLTLLINHIGGYYDTIFQARKELKFLAIRRNIQSLSLLIPAFIAVKFGCNILYIVSLSVIASFISVFFEIYQAKKRYNFRLNFANILPLYKDKRYFKPALVFSVLGLIGFFYSRIDILMLSWMIGAKEVALYSVGYKFIKPLELLGQMGAIAFFPLVVEKFKNQKKISKKVLFKSTGFLALFIFPISILGFIFAEFLVLNLFGDKYYQSIEVLKILIWIIPLGIITWPFILSMQANHHEKKLIIPNILRSLCNVILNYIFIKKYGYIGVVYSTLIVYFWYFIFVNIGYQYFILKRSGNIY